MKALAAVDQNIQWNENEEMIHLEADYEAI
jgi:hypothetical protein